MNAVKKIIEYIGYGFATLIFFGAVIVIGRTIYTNVWIALVTLVSCPLMAFAFMKDKDSNENNNLQSLLFGILLLCGFSSFTSVMSKENAFTKVQSVLLKGQIKREQLWVEESENDEGESEPSHYETEYHFEMAPNQPKYVSSLIDWGLFILAFGIPVLTWYIMRKSLH